MIVQEVIHIYCVMLIKRHITKHEPNSIVTSFILTTFYWNELPLDLRTRQLINCKQHITGKIFTLQSLFLWSKWNGLYYIYNSKYSTHLVPCIFYIMYIWWFYYNCSITCFFWCKSVVKFNMMVYALPTKIHWFYNVFYTVVLTL